MSPSFYTLHPLAQVADLCQLPAISAPQFSQAMVHVLWAFALGGVLTVLCADFIRQGVFFFLTRLPSWRRFDRAMARLFWRDRR